MTDALQHPGALGSRIVVTPNRPLSTAGLVVFFTSIVAVTLAIAGVLTMVGYWPVLVYAVAEMLLLAVAFRAVLRAARYRETLTVTRDTLKVEKGDGRVTEVAEFHRYWARVWMQHPVSRLHKTRLLLGSHGRECEVGCCLTERKRHDLADRLHELLGPQA